MFLFNCFLLLEADFFFVGAYTNFWAWLPALSGQVHLPTSERPFRSGTMQWFFLNALYYFYWDWNSLMHEFFLAAGLSKYFLLKNVTILYLAWSLSQVATILWKWKWKGNSFILTVSMVVLSSKVWCLINKLTFVEHHICSK